MKVCNWGNTRDVEVYIQPRLSHTNIGRRDIKKIDSCIATIVEALQAKGINMISSCCGHGKCDGEIVLQDGRMLIIKKQGNL